MKHQTSYDHAVCSNLWIYIWDICLIFCEEFEQLSTELHTKHFQKTPKIAFLHKDYQIPRGTGMLKMRGLMVVWGEHVGAQMSLSLFAPPFLSHLVTSWNLLWTLRSFWRAGNGWVKWEKWRMRWQFCQLPWGPELLCWPSWDVRDILRQPYWVP
ncbi:hypothetical protein BXZ70DRAFT_1058368 [Cristinia sonorae]|uniref:Uncharacterized protein n=1 Tax=Cristinia sonorae TaxID=1940300 RepID=A0A8K0UCP8_9AGAR|nr:hypothetical protein BXZ70DRAFT_1058368 [Cristinia sonorae]